MKSTQIAMERLSAVVGSRYGALLIVLVAQMVLFSFLDGHIVVRWLLDLSVLVMIGSVIHAISGRWWLKAFVVVVGLGSVLLGSLSREFDLHVLFPIGTLGKALVFGVIIVVIFTDVVSRREVEMDAVLGACCVYLLIGVGWEAIYEFIAWQNPNAFALPSGIPAADGGPLAAAVQSDLVYFSLITMTTIGYGDITPKSPPAKVLSALQGVVAQLYIAIIIARLVGMELANRRNGPSKEQ